MQAHDHTAIDIACRHKGGWQFEVPANNAVERVVCFFVGEVGASVAQGTELLLVDVVAQHRRVMSLN